MSRNQNRHKIKQWFFTFPKSGDLTKQEFMNSLTEFSPSLYYKCVKESHKDGTSHLHAIYKFTYGVSKANLLKFLKEEYPNDWKRIHIAPVRSMLKAQEYLSKEDQNPLISGEIIETRGRPKFQGRQPILNFVPAMIEAKMQAFDRANALQHLRTLHDELRLVNKEPENYPEGIKSKMESEISELHKKLFSSEIIFPKNIKSPLTFS